jgi:hypothetical protein
LDVFRTVSAGEEPRAGVTDRNTAKRLMRRPKAWVGRLILRNGPPPDHDIALIPLTHESRDVNIRTREIRSRVEEIKKLPASENMQWCIWIDLSQSLLPSAVLESFDRAWARHTLQFPDRLGSRFNFRDVIRSDARAIGILPLLKPLLFIFGADVLSCCVCVPTIDNHNLAFAAIPRAASEPLNKGGPRREFSHENVGGYVHPGLDHLGCHDNSVLARLAVLPS